MEKGTENKFAEELNLAYNKEFDKEITKIEVSISDGVEIVS